MGGNGKAGKASHERGSILVVLLASMFLLAGGIVALLSAELARSRRAVRSVELGRAFTIAESGVHAVAVLLEGNAFDEDSVLDWSSDGEDNDGDGSVDEGDESLVATAELWGNDEVDNDGDGETDEGDEWVARVSCAATVGVSTTRVTGWVRQEESILPFSAPAPLNLLDPNADVNFAGNAFQISGVDRNLDGTAGPSAPVYGIAIQGDPSQVTSQLGVQQLDNVVGLGGYPSVGTWSPGSAGFIDNMIEALQPSAALNLHMPTGTYTGSLGDWQAGNIFITYSDTDLSVSGSSSGAGVLLVDGDLTIAAGFNYVGYIFVTGRIRFVGGGSTTRLTGAVFVDTDIQQGTGTTGTLVGSVLNIITGTVDFRYSTEALTLVRSAFDDWSVVAMTEP